MAWAANRVGPPEDTVTKWLLCAALLFAASAAAQNADTGAQLSGSLHHSITGVPVPKASIRLIPVDGKIGYIRTTGVTGEFAFDGLAPGNYQVRIESRGMNTTPAGGGAVRLAAGQKITSFDLSAVPFASISGKVTEGEDPIPGATVRALALRWSYSGRWFDEVASERANDRGEFRISGLEPGRYILYAGGPEEGPLLNVVRDASGKGERRLAGAYYPNATAIEGAAILEIRPGQAMGGLAMRLAWTPCFHVRGALAANVHEIQLARRWGDHSLPWETMGEDRRKDGTFDIPGVTPGEYFVRPVLDRGPQGPTARITVDTRDIDGLAISGQDPPFHAQVRMDNGEPIPAPVNLLLAPVQGMETGRQQTIAVSQDGSARIPSLRPTSYTLTVAAKEGIYVKSVTVGQQEVRSPVLEFRMGAPVELEIVLATGAGKVGGTVQQADANTRVLAVLVPEQPRAGIPLAWFSDVDQNGGFGFAGVPAGKYLAFVTTEVQNGLWMNREFIEQVRSNATAVELAEKGEAQVKPALLPAFAVQRAIESLR